MHPSIVCIKVDLGACNNEFWMLLRGDAHHDNPHSDHDRQRADLDEAVRRGACVLDVGDLFCAMGGKYDPRFVRGGTTRPEHVDAHDYFDSLVRHNAEFLRPYARHIAIIASGNHESSVRKRQETDLTARLVERINTLEGTHIENGGYGGEVHLRFDHNGHYASLWLTYFHGSGGGGLMSFDTLRVRRQASWNPYADVVVCGHVHERWALEMTRKVVRCEGYGAYEVALRPQWHIRTGTYKDEYGHGREGWHVESGRPPKPVGAMWGRFTLSRPAGIGSHVKMEFTPT